MAKEKQQPGSDKERTTFYLSPDFKIKMKYVAFMSEKTQTLIVDEALTDYFAKWEKKNGAIPKK